MEFSTSEELSAGFVKQIVWESDLDPAKQNPFPFKGTHFF